jgi:hypothetical protein
MLIAAAPGERDSAQAWQRVAVGIGRAPACAAKSLKRASAEATDPILAALQTRVRRVSGASRETSRSWRNAGCQAAGSFATSRSARPQRSAGAAFFATRDARSTYYTYVSSR